MFTQIPLFLMNLWVFLREPAQVEKDTVSGDVVKLEGDQPLLAV